VKTARLSGGHFDGRAVHLDSDDLPLIGIHMPRYDPDDGLVADVYMPAGDGTLAYVYRETLKPLELPDDDDEPPAPEADYTVDFYDASGRVVAQFGHAQTTGPCNYDIPPGAVRVTVTLASASMPMPPAGLVEGEL